MPVSLVHGSTSDQRSGAILSPDPGRSYRYALERRWGSGPFVMFVMLNPSTADEHKDDATIRRCISFAKDWGAGGLLVGNLFSWRTKDPVELREAAGAGIDIVGPDCDVWLTTMSLRSIFIVVAWGSQPRISDRIAQTRNLFRGSAVMSLGRCGDGNPRHPVRLAKTTELEPFSWT